MTKNMLTLMPKLRKSSIDMVGWCQLLLWDERCGSRTNLIHFREEITKEEVAFTSRTKIRWLFESNDMVGPIIKDEFRKIVGEDNEEAGISAAVD